MDTSTNAQILTDAEGFDDFGGWVLDSQFELEMGAPYLLAMVMVAWLQTPQLAFPLRTSESTTSGCVLSIWLPGYDPGRFEVRVNGDLLGTQFGANDQDWSWQLVGSVELVTGETKLALHDLTGFCGRCDAVFFSIDSTPPPNAVNEASRAWRRKLRGLPNEPVDAGTFDVVVAGGGVIRAATARLGERVALVQDRPYPGW